MIESSEKLSEIKNAIQKAKRAADRANRLVFEVFELLQGIDLSVETEAENADNLEEAISCYIDYGEFGLANVMREIGEAFKLQKDGEA